MSEEHLRRLCHRHDQRNPVDHRTHLRLRRAGTMLRSSSAKLEEIAGNVGYASAYSFPAAFRRWSSLPPARREVTKKPGAMNRTGAKPRGGPLNRVLDQNRLSDTFV